MFFPAKGPAEPAVRELRALRLSLNTPVVAIDCLPVGPARAAIALHAASPERIRVSVAVRSLRTGEIAFFNSGDEIQDLGHAGVALDAALSFAEGMGFLFDDDEVEARGPSGPQEAAGLWRELLGAEPEPQPTRELPRPAPPPARAPERPVLRPTPEASSNARRPFWLDAPPEPRPPARPRPRAALGQVSLRSALEASEQLDEVSDEGISPHFVAPRRPDPEPAAPPKVATAPDARADAPPRPGALFQVIAQTTIDRICGDRPDAEEGAPPLTKFRFLRPAPVVTAGAEPEPRPGEGAGPDGCGVPASASPPPDRRAGLRALQLRLLSRF